MVEAGRRFLPAGRERRFLGSASASVGYAARGMSSARGQNPPFLYGANRARKEPSVVRIKRVTHSPEKDHAITSGFELFEGIRRL